MVSSTQEQSKPHQRNGAHLTVALLADARRLPAEFLRELGLTDLPGGVGIPYHTTEGELIAVKRRTALVAKEGSYWPKGEPLAAYGQWRLDGARKAGQLILVEGESDCWALWHHDFPALGIPGADAAEVLQGEHVEGLERLYVWREPDRGGERFVPAVAGRLARLGWRGQLLEVRIAGVKDPADLHATDEARFRDRLQAALAVATEVPLPAADKPGATDGRDGADGRGRTSSRRTTRAALPQAEILLALAAGQDYFHAPDGRAFATVEVEEEGQTHYETHPIRGKDFRGWLARRYYQRTRKAPSAGVTQDALGVLEARARYDGPQREVCCRVGQAGGRFYLDLCDRRWRVVEIDAAGWRILDASPVRFRRARGMLTLPEPQRGGTLDELRPFVNLDRDKDDWLLVIAWLVQALTPAGPYPVLCLHGEQGSAKSTTSRVLRSLVDPSMAPLRTVPRDERDLVIAAGNSWLLTLDNLSHLDGWLSDALCRLATGGGFSTRELYTDSDEVIFDAQRPVLLNGIEELSSRPDLLDRALVLQLPALGEEERRAERDFWERWEAARPRVLGALLDALAGALRHRGQVQLARLPRMADFALVAEAAGRALGWKEGAFLDAYELNRDEQNAAALDGSVIYTPLKELLAGGTCWEGSCQDLLGRLTELAGDKAKAKNWPRSPRALSGILRRLTTNLRRQGIRVTFGRGPGKGRPRVVRVELEQVCNGPSAPSVPSDPAENPCPEADGCGRSADGGPDRPSAPAPHSGCGADGADGADGEMRDCSKDDKTVEVEGGWCQSVPDEVKDLIHRLGKGG